jgi:hypothetical protein
MTTPHDQPAGGEATVRAEAPTPPDGHRPTRRTFIGAGSALGGAAALGAIGAPAAAAAARGRHASAATITTAAGQTPAPPTESPGGIAGEFTDVLPSVELPAAAIEYAASVASPSDGDLWPSCWADDGEIYAANGDGTGFDPSAPGADTVVNRISGTPETSITGTRLAAGAALTPVWSDPSSYNRKPTGMTCVDGVLYLAIQDLRYGGHAFNDAPAASITRSDDHGATWTPTSAPMFADHRFTTIFFLDFGQDSQLARGALGPADGGYVYAYGLDWNWRDSYDETIPAPTRLYLARVARASVQDRSAWTFFTGLDRSGRPAWSPQITDKIPVLVDERRLYDELRSQTDPRSLSVVSQGGVVYNAPLRRYLYTSWTEYTFEFYEAPAPWGPWRLFLHHDAGDYPWFGPGNGVPGPKNGGYATTIPSKFISADGLSMWVQSNWFVGNGGGANNYHFSLRRLQISPRLSTPQNLPANLARAPGVAAIEKSAHYGHGSYYNDGNLSQSEDSFDNASKLIDFWGYTFPYPVQIGRLVYTTGTMFGDGGWFSPYDGGLRVEVRQNGVWSQVAGRRTTPAYPYDSSAGPNHSYTLQFTPVTADGVRIIGQPGGTSFFTSIAELEVYGR